MVKGNTAAAIEEILIKKRLDKELQEGLTELKDSLRRSVITSSGKRSRRSSGKKLKVSGTSGAKGLIGLI